MSDATDDITYPHAGLFLALHLAAIGVLWSGVTTESIILGATLYFVRMFAVCAGYHRYFAHRTYATSRAFQFVLACLAQSSGQKSVLWWAAMHRHHHQCSDTEDDVHSPRIGGFWHSHVGWIFLARHDRADLSKVPDLARYPELLWLHRLEKVPAAALAVATWLVAGWPGLVIGFVWSTIILYHATFCINSLAHVHGTRRYLTGDESRNNWLLAVITLGEGWHNNHHASPSSVRQGFEWWEFDLAYYLLVALRKAGLVWGFRLPPASRAANERSPGSVVLNRAARQLLRSFWGRHNVRKSFASSFTHFSPGAAPNREVLAHVPTRDQLRERAVTLFPRSPAIEEVVDRAYSMLTELGREEGYDGALVKSNLRRLAGFFCSSAICWTSAMILLLSFAPLMRTNASLRTSPSVVAMNSDINSGNSAPSACGEAPISFGAPS